MEPESQTSRTCSFQTIDYELFDDTILSTPKPFRVNRVVSGTTQSMTSNNDHFNSCHVESWSPFSSTEALAKCSGSHKAPTYCNNEMGGTFSHNTTIRSQSLTTQPSYISTDKIEPRSKVCAISDQKTFVRTHNVSQ